MTKGIKRIAALILAGILLICVSFASLAEEADKNLNTEHTNLEETETTEETKAEKITATEDTTEETTGTAAEDTEAEETTGTNDDTADDEYDELADDNDELDNNDELADEDFDELAEDDYDELAGDDYDELADFTEFGDEMEFQTLDDDGGYIDPEVTVSIIKNGETVEKKKVALPQKLVNIKKCKNPRCITSVEKDLDQIFVLTDRENQIYRCHYCETSLKD